MKGFAESKNFKQSVYSAICEFLIIKNIPINIYSLFMRRREQGKYNSLLYATFPGKNCTTRRRDVIIIHAGEVVVVDNAMLLLCCCCVVG